MSDMAIKKLASIYDLNEILFRESLNIPRGWSKQVYFNPNTKEIFCSLSEKENKWINSANKVGAITSFNFADVKGWKQINEKFVEVNDGSNKIDMYFQDSEYERSFENGSIIDKEVAIDRILANKVAAEDWYKEIENSNVKKAY